MSERILHFVGGLSATGKTVMTDHLKNDLEGIGIGTKKPVCYTTRPIRANYGEVDGRDYNFISKEDFRINFAPQIAKDPEGTWDVSVIHNEIYFNKISLTLPDEQHPISILPIHLGTVEEMRKIYSKLGIKIYELHIIIPPELYDVWKVQMGALRPSRDPAIELSLQKSTLERGILSGKIFEPVWFLNTDKERFAFQAKKLMGII